MAEPDFHAASESKRELSPPLAAFLGWVAIAFANAIFITVAIPRPQAGLLVRALHHFYDAGHLFALGSLSMLTSTAWIRVRPRFARRAWITVGLVSAIALGVGSLLLGSDLDNLASRLAIKAHLAGFWPWLILNLLVGATSLGIPVAWLLGRATARLRVRFLGLAIGLGAAVANELILKNDYDGAHFFLGWASAVLIGAALDGSSLGRIKPTRLWGRLAFGVLVCWGVAAVAMRPSTNVLLQLYATPGSALTPFLARIRGRVVPAHLTASIPPDQAVWFANRDDAPDVPPYEPTLTNGQVVIFLGIDSVRADVLEDPRYLAELPELERLKTSSVYFSHARSPGPGTVFTYSALFASRYFSEMYWSDKSGAGIWPWEDQSLRFPELLGRHRVTTVDFASILWFTNEWGVARGFAEETNMDPRTSDSHATAAELVDAIYSRLTKQGPEPLFVFAHFMDAHYPYDRGSKTGPPKDRFVSELALVDKQIARLNAAISKMSLASRTTLIVTADHGEAFGEHDTTQHGTTLYEELLRVPLIISSPGVAPREITEPVSLIDIGPTILDLFGAPTPGSYMGQSLVPFLRGETPKLSRPIIAEGRLKRSLVFRDDFKVITDERRGTVELYDLASDPGELHNLALEGSAQAEPRVGAIDTFFQAHTLKRPGYQPPYRP